jgi:anthranilate 1,2-dioxygenase large subunit
MRNRPSLSWPAADLSRIPFAAYCDPALYEEEQELIFRGPTWNYLALEVELPNAGDFLTTKLGDTPILVNRDADGELHAFVNRCMHRGTLLCRERQGNAASHICPYHQWAYDLKGQLRAVPFPRGVNGHGGLPEDFDRKKIRLHALTVECYKGVIFGTFSDAAEPLMAYLGPEVVYELDRLFHKPIRILGHQRQNIFGNWKLYNDNVRDANHGGLLHMFHATFGLYRLSQKGGAKMDARGRHNITWSAIGTDDEKTTREGYAGTKKVFKPKFTLKDMSMLQNRTEYPDDVTLVIMSVFPNVVFQQISNSLCTRQIRTRDIDRMELYWTYFGYEDDDEDMTRHRLDQANLVGPGGLISMEDGEAVELVQIAIQREQDKHALVEIGGKGEIKTQESLVTEVPIRGFYSYYCELMGFPVGAEAAAE